MSCGDIITGVFRFSLASLRYGEAKAVPVRAMDAYGVSEV
jgi:hypothetical protein